MIPGICSDRGLKISPSCLLNPWHEAAARCGAGGSVCTGRGEPSLSGPVTIAPSIVVPSVVVPHWANGLNSWSFLYAIRVFVGLRLDLGFGSRLELG